MRIRFLARAVSAQRDELPVVKCRCKPSIPSLASCCVFITRLANRCNDHVHTHGAGFEIFGRYGLGLFEPGSLGYCVQFFPKELLKG